MDNNNYHWISFSDVMTALMVLFMFIAISYMLQIQREKQYMEDILQDFTGTKKELVYELDSAFTNFFEKYENIYLDSTDLSIKFQNPQVLFSSGQYKVSPYFKEILNEFTPIYISVITQEKYKDKISEVRIEGHTDTVPTGETGDPYIDNLILSQKRTVSVMTFLMNHPEILNSNFKDWLLHKLVANGFSYSKALDKSGKFIYTSEKEIDASLSRRVEFRIITQSEKLIQRALNNKNQLPNNKISNNKK